MNTHKPLPMAKSRAALKKRAPRKTRRLTKGCGKGNTFKRNPKSDSPQLHHLPDDVLRSILSRLTFRESLRMGLLSHEWQRLWRCCCPELVFTRATMFQHGNTSTRCTWNNFARRVNSLLRQICSPPILNKFVLKFGLCRKHTCHVNRWVRFCAVSRARHITLDFTPGVKGVASGLADDKYIIPLHVFSDPDSSSAHIKSLHLGYVCLNTATTSFVGFANLKKLTLHKVSFLSDLLCIMLPECTALEWLSISCCSLPGLTSRKPLHRLHYLCVQHCYLEKIELETPNLTLFDFTDQPILAQGAPVKVTEANINLLDGHPSHGDNLDYIYTELPAALPIVQKLSISSNLDIYDGLQAFAKTSARFINLTHLTMFLPLYGDIESVGGILRLVYLLELAPNMEELELHLHTYHVVVGEALRGNIPPYRHDKLKRVLISGGCQWFGLIELAYYILRSASRLECMIMDPEMRIKGPSLLSPLGWMLDKGRRMAKKLLEREEFQGILTIL